MISGRFSGKLALVTGAASSAGIGFATARRLASEGCEVILADLDPGALEQRVREIAALQGSAHLHVLDVRSEERWIDLGERIEKAWGGLDVLVNNAGVIRLDPVESIERADWQRMMDVNLTGTYLGVKHMARLMRLRGRGAIVNMSSVAGLQASPGCGAYAATKGGVRLFTKCAALDLSKSGIRVNSVHPGFIQTDMQNDVQKGYSAEDYGRAVLVVPLARAGTPDDVAGTVAFLASGDADYITGAEFVVDGGLSAV